MIFFFKKKNVFTHIIYPRYITARPGPNPAIRAQSGSGGESQLWISGAEMYIMLNLPGENLKYSIPSSLTVFLACLYLFVAATPQPLSGYFVFGRNYSVHKLLIEDGYFLNAFQPCCCSRSVDSFTLLLSNGLWWLDAGFKSCDTGSRADQSIIRRIHGNSNGYDRVEVNVFRH